MCLCDVCAYRWMSIRATMDPEMRLNYVCQQSGYNTHSSRASCTQLLVPNDSAMHFTGRLEEQG